MDDPGPEDPVDQADFRIPVKKPVDKSTGPVTRCRVDDQSGGFVHYEDVFVLIDDPEVNGFWDEVQVLDLLDENFHLNSLVELQRRLGNLSRRKADFAFSDQPVSVASSQPEAPADQDIQPGSRLFGQDLKRFAAFFLEGACVAFIKVWGFPPVFPR